MPVILRFLGGVAVALWAVGAFAQERDLSQPPSYIIFDMTDPEDRLRALAAMQERAKVPSAAEIEAATRPWREARLSPEVLKTRIEESDLPLQERMSLAMRLQLAGADPVQLAEIAADLNRALGQP